MSCATLVSLLVALLALGLVAGCGGDDEAADSSTDVDTLLEETFAGGKAIESGRISAGARRRRPKTRTSR